MIKTTQLNESYQPACPPWPLPFPVLLLLLLPTTLLLKLLPPLFQVNYERTVNTAKTINSRFVPFVKSIKRQLIWFVFIIKPFFFYPFHLKSFGPICLYFMNSSGFKVLTLYRSDKRVIDCISIFKHQRSRVGEVLMGLLNFLLVPC